MAPTVSIVTVCLNDAAGLESTLSSVARQSFADREVIVVDGGSTDGTLDVIRANPDVVTDWVTGRDGGIYDGQNKGARRSRGNWLMFLNAGDTLAAGDALERLFEGPPREDILYGDVICEEPDGRRRLGVQPNTLSLSFFMRTTLPHQATAVRRELFEEVGPYDTALRIAADYEFFLKAIVVRGASTRHVPVPLAVQVAGGLSSRPESFPVLRAERKLARDRVLSPLIKANWEAYLRAKRGAIVYHCRNAFRPTARKLRRISRRLRGKPDCDV